MDWVHEHSHNSFDMQSLLNSFPGDLEFKQIFSDIDEQMEQNAASIEHCIKEIQTEVNKQCPDVQLQTATDCFEWLTNYNYSTSKSPCISYGDLIKFLKTLQDLLKDEQNQEEMILDLLWDLSCQTRVSLPSTLSETSFHFLSRTSLHSVEDHSPLEVTSIWDDIRLHLRRFLVSRLQSHNKINNLQQKILLKNQCIQQLLFLYPESEVITKYQNIQNKLLTELLQNSFPSYSRDSNLDTTAQRYQNAMLKLYLVMKEDFDTLYEILAPSSTAKFIKETYLDTITEETAQFLKNFCELQFKENAVRVVKTSKSSSKHRGAVHALVTPECPEKGRNFSLSLDELKFLSELIKSFLKLENNVQKLFEEMFLLLKMPRNTSGILEKSNRGVITEKPRANEINIPSERLLPVKEFKFQAVLLDFGWRNAFKEVSLPMAHCITTAVEDFSTKILQQEQNERSSAVSYTMSLVNVQQVWQDGHVFPEEEQPKKIAKFCSDIMEKLDTMLPLALACRDESFQEIRANLVEAWGKVATAVLARLQERGREVPSRAPLKNLHALLSTAVYLFQHFMQYDNLMKETTKKPVFLVPVQRYQELINTLQFQVTDYCVRVCATSILQDAESHHWDDYKAFYEGERCSFSLQMWHYFYWALHHDLWTILPPKLAQEILAEVLEKYLGLLASRYALAHPSYKRTPQIRLDVTTILICTENMLWSVCTSVQKLLNPHKYEDDKIFKIHTHCNNLLTTLAILTSPLKELYETFQHGLDESASDSEINQPLHWVSCISHFYPSLLRTPSTRGLKAEGRLKLLLAQPSCNWNLLLETLLSGDGLLPRILLQSSKCTFQEQVSDTENHLTPGPSLVEAIFRVLYHCNFSPEIFGNVFVSYIEEEQLWNFLYNIPVSTCLESKLEVIRCLRLALTDAIKDIVQQVIATMSCGRSCATNANKYSVPEHLLESIPKEWSYTPKETKGNESNRGSTRLAAQAVSIVISKLPTVIACLPPSIKYFFFLSERKMSKNFVELKKAGLLVWNLIVLLCRICEDGNTVELLTGASLDRWSKEKLGLICVCLESIMGEQNIPNQMAQKVIQSIEQQKPNWIERQLLKARKLSTECAFMAVEKSAVLEEGDTALELTEQKINMMVLDVCHKPGGSEYLRQIYHIMRLNEEYLKEQLFSMNGSEEKPLPIRPLKTTLSGVEDQPSAFNPFHVYKVFSENMLDQSVITKWNWNWSNLLPNYLGLDKMTFNVLFKNRWEMRKDERLEEEEKAMVEHLNQICTVQNSSASDNTEEQ